MFWLLLATTFIIIGSALIAERLAFKGAIDRLLAIGIVSLTAQILILLVAGVGLKRLGHITVFVLALFLLGIGLLLFRKQFAKLKKSKKNFLQYLKDFFGAARIFFANNLLGKAVTIILFISLAAIGLGLIYLPPYAWDEIWYHLTPIAAWYKQGAITQLPEAVLWQNYNPDAVGFDQLAFDLSVAYNWANVYPLNVEMGALWTMVLAGSDVLADAAQVPYVLLGALATFGLSRMVKAQYITSILAAMLFLLTPMVLIHLRTAYVDAAFAAMVTVSLYLFLKWQKQRQINYALLLGLAAGLMLGIKSTGLAFAAVFILAITAYGVGQCRHRKMKYRELGLQLGLILSALFIVGGFWYLRTWWFYGNPIYPVKIEILGRSLPGLGSVWQLFMFHNTPPNYQGRNIILNIFASWLELGDESYNYYSRTRGLGPVWAAFALPAILPFTFYAWRQRYAPALWMVAMTLIFLVIQPAVWWPRYVLYIVPVGLTAWAWVYVRLQNKVKVLVASLMMLNLLVSTSLTLGETLSRLPWAMQKPNICRTFGQLYHSDYAWVDVIPPSNIGHAPMAWIYPLYGGLRHQVQLIDGDSIESWRESICSQKLNFLVVKRSYREYDNWAKALTGLLENYIEGEEINVYRIKH